MSYTDQLLIDIARRLNDLLLKEEDKIPYNINLINELHINENAHSRILNVLLRYYNQGRYPIFESFVEYLFSNSMCTSQRIIIGTPIFSCEEGRIDLLVKEIDKYGIIIENKVQGAVDQNKQVERYIDSVIHLGLSEHNIYLIYLTKDGSKEINECSLTDKAKNILEYGMEQSRFITINYKDQILPWLEEIILPNCQIKETLLISAITQYIDYLKGYLGLKSQQLLAQDKMNEFITNELKIDSIKDAIEIKTNLSQLKDTVENIIQGHINKIAIEFILNPLDAYVRQFGCAVDFIECHFSNYGLFEIKIKNNNWEKCVMRFNLEGCGFIYGVSHIDVVNHIDNDLNKCIRERMSELNFKQSDWWPCYKNIRKSYAPDGADYWMKVEYGEILILDCLKECFNEVFYATKGYRL